MPRGTEKPGGGTAHPPKLPAEGVVGVLAGDVPLPEALRELSDLAKCGLAGVEIRADLFPTPEDAIASLPWIPPNLPAVFTLRAASQGGKFRGDEGDRIRIYRAALAAGAAWVDAEWGSEAAREAAREHLPLVVSHHDFSGTPRVQDLEEIAQSMAAIGSLAIKVVPTAHNLACAIEMLRWLEARRAGTPRRIGFAMGGAGFLTRVLALSWGSPLTYASVGRTVAPGQVAVRELLEVYRPHRRTRSTRIFGVVGNPVHHSLSPHIHNPALASRGLDALYLPLQAQNLDEVLEALHILPIDGLSITIPFKEDAFRSAGVLDERSRTAGATNTWKITRGPAGQISVQGFNTDVDGVLVPLTRRLDRLTGVSAAVLGNGGAARGAVRALIEGGATPTLYFRNSERGSAVADGLGIRGRHLDALKPALERREHRIVINATSLGLKPADPSPVESGALSRGILAFEMIYEPAETRFLAEARAAGCECIPGGEMLVAQAVGQFKIFTGLDADYDELEGNFQRGLAIRHAMV